MANVERRAPDLSGYPGLVVIYLGMRVRTWFGIKTLLGFGPRINAAVGEQPEGLLLHEIFLWSLFPPHAGERTCPRRRTRRSRRSWRTRSMAGAEALYRAALRVLTNGSRVLTTDISRAPTLP